MFPKNKKLIALLVLVLFAVFTGVIWIQVFQQNSTGKLTVTFLNVGQGDSIFIETPSKRQILIDGGRDDSVLKELNKVMPLWDKTIDIIIATHPDSDHITGLIDVLKRYRVDTFIRSNVAYRTSSSKELIKVADDTKTKEIFAKRGQLFNFGDGAYMTVLFPDRDVSGFESNTASVIVRITFGNQSFLLSGDSPKKIEKYIVSLDSNRLSSTVLKAGHHGSRTSSSQIFVGFVNPEYAVLSRGCNNKYGHPHKEVLDILNNFGIKILDTCKEGNITFVTDGNILQVKK